MKRSREESDQAGNQDGITGNKRRRTAIACAACRTRKSRCDGKRPKCSPCEDMAFDCNYIQSTTSPNVIVGRDYLSTLENRVRTVEQALESVQSQLDDIRASGQTFRAENINASAPGQNSSLVVQDVSEDTERVDAMGVVVFTNEEESGFFGPSSNIAFLRHISQAAAEASNVSFHSPRVDSSSEFIDGGLFSFSRSSPRRRDCRNQSSQNVDLFVLPSESVVMDLLSQFFSYPGYLYPYIHEDTFIETYIQIKDSSRPTVRRTWLGLFNIILAMAVGTRINVDIDATKRFEGSDIYYQRAVGLCSKQIMRGTSLEIVHYLLILGQYLRGTQKSIEAWVVHGLAVKAAMQLGLHSSECSRGLPPLEQEIRKRTWFGCVVLDRTLSMTFGRPSAIPDSYVRLEMPSEKFFYPQPHLSSSWEAKNPLNVAFFASTIKLYQVLWNVLDQLYGQNIGCEKPPGISETVTRLFGIEQQLLTWEQNLCPDLQILTHYDLAAQTGQPDLDHTQRTRQRLRTILTLRYLNIRLLLHRPILVKFLDSRNGVKRDTNEMKMLQQIGSHSIQVSMCTASEIISIVHMIVTATGYQRKLVGAWWYTLYFTFNAALVVFGSFLVSRSQNVASDQFFIITADEAMEHLTRSLRALELLDRGNHMVERCRHYLHLLFTVLKATEAPKSTSTSTRVMIPEDLMVSPSLPFTFGVGNDFGPEESSLGMNVNDFLGINFNF
ncbi:uncharacterized protein Z518_00473 [Rhinocladiella mackenziei CBS 650.93]|uniref:Zn(2)-C6 fungal-type domain-containing protein n=1 Tax=Rhinocladiella mackenziei CBS 650.93 TaxID=1442369 RepID=A0A0D2ITI4_9EURO|nr:uncharacterized protein Z518_00473 [Rhinocladiella mackenziei CBS 650.93]KIX09394.1 hypothetical protein Z518_00473 [Rhinocladiella mackenziei CBS 650.93]